MAKLIDPDSLNQGTEVIINSGSKTIQLLAAGNLSNSSPGASSGVTLQALYSFLKEEWKSDNNLNKFKFPLKMYTKTDGTFINSWTFNDQTSRNLIRDAGWTEGTSSFAGIVTLGSFDATTDQAYYQQTVGYGQSTSSFNKTGNINESVPISGATSYLKCFLRIVSKSYSEYDLLDEQGITALEPVLYKLPLANSTDLKITVADETITGSHPYIGIKVNYLKGKTFATWANATVYQSESVVYDTANSRWYYSNNGGTSNGANRAGDSGVTDWASYNGEAQIGTSYYAFNRIVYASGATDTQIYNWAQKLLRSSSDINANDSTTVNQRLGTTVKGNVAELLFEYVGDTLKTKPGVFISAFASSSTNSITFRDITVNGGGVDSITRLPVTTTERNFPFVATGYLNFSTNLVNESDSDTKYVMYFLSASVNTFNSGNAVVVNDNSGTPISGSITNSAIAWSFDYDNNSQGGRTPATDADVVIVAQGLSGATWVQTSYTITRTTGQNITITADDERNYSNPA